MNRREALVAVGGLLGAGAAVTAVIPVGAQEDDEGEEADEENGEDENGDEAGDAEDEENGEGDGEEAEGEEDDEEDAAGGTETVDVGDNYFEPEDLSIEPGTTVEWVWVGEADHNVNPDSQPDEADWEGHPDLQADGEYSHTFEVEGTYDYVCDPHVGVGMVGSIEVTEDADEQAAEADVDVDDLGVPLQKHFVGVATFLAIFVSLVFTFYLLKYGESPNTSSPGRDR